MDPKIYGLELNKYKHKETSLQYQSRDLQSIDLDNGI